MSNSNSSVSLRFLHPPYLDVLLLILLSQNQDIHGVSHYLLSLMAVLLFPSTDECSSNSTLRCRAEKYTKNKIKLIEEHHVIVLTGEGLFKQHSINQPDEIPRKARVRQCVRQKIQIQLYDRQQSHVTTRWHHLKFLFSFRDIQKNSCKNMHFVIYNC